MNKTFYKIMGIAITIATPFAVYAAYSGPTATPTGNNTAGPVWLSPSAQQTGTLNISSNGIIGGNVQMTTGKAIDVNATGATSLYLSNYNGGATAFTANVRGDLTISGFGGVTTGTLNVPTICLNGTCRNSWPSGSGGTIGGSGTANRLARFSAGTTLTSSILSDGGSSIALLNTDGSIGIQMRPGGIGLANTFIGNGSGNANPSGTVNTALGSNALNLLTTGSANTAIGEEALMQITTGANNTAVGVKTLQVSTANQNTAIGSTAMWGNTTGADNVAVGYAALDSNTTGNRNTALGSAAGADVVSGSDSTFLGYNADATGVLTNVTALGANALVTASNSVILGNAANVGIGVSNPGAKLTVVGATTNPSTYDDGKAMFASANTGGPNVSIAEFRHDNLSQGVGIGYASVFATGANASQDLDVFSRGTGSLRLNVSGGGNVGVGTATITNKLQVGGGTRAAIGFDNLYGAPTNGTVDSNGDKLVFYNNGTSQSYRIGLGAAADMWYQSAGSHRFLTGATNASIGNETLFLASNGNVNIGSTAIPSYRLDVNGDIIGSWHRSRGATGWYNETYAGGWYMADASWVRSYNDKNVWTGNGLLGSNGGLTIGYGGVASPAGGAIIAGNVGIGTSAPTAKLDVTSAITTISGVNTAGSSGGTGVYGSCSGGNCSGVHGYTSGGGQGVYGTGGTGVRGDGSTFGVAGISASFAGAGVRGDNNSGSGPGVQGVNMNGGGRGVQGNGGMYGVYGDSEGFGVYGTSVNGRGVYGSGGTYGVQASSNYAGIYSYGNSYSFYGGGGNFYNAGRTSIGTTAASVPLTVVADSSVYAQLWAQSNDVNCGYAATAYTDGNFYLNRWCGSASASAYMTPAGNWVAYSDRDLKTDIKKIHYGIDEVMKLKPVTYTRKDDKDHTKLIGFIAQDVKEIMPEFVTGKAISEGGTGLGLNYSGLTTVLAGGIQDQQKEIDALKTQNADLLKRLEALEAKIK